MLKPLILIKGVFAPRLIPQAVFLFAWFLLSGVCHAQETNAQVQVRVFMEGLLKPVPEMVLVRTGMFNIGTEGSTGPQNTIWNNGTIETDSNQNFEGSCDQNNMNCMRPLVSIPQPFEVSRYEITREEFKFFLDSTTEEITPHNVWNDPRYYARNIEHPAAYVSWQDAQAYVRWLSAETGQQYRLLSESEWEYATRARTETAYFFGDTITTADANYNSQGTVPVGSYDANAFGLYDVHGNVWEWVEDCQHQNYNGLPTNGSAWDSSCENDTIFMLRGGAWDSTNESLLRSAQRGIGSQGRRFNNVGFRVARTLTTRLTIANLTPDTNIILLHGDISVSTDVEVVLNVDMGSGGTLEVESNDPSIVSVSVADTQISPAAGSNQTTVKFTLTPQGQGNTMVTISVVDNQGITNEVTISVEVRPVYPEMVGVPRGTYTMGSPSGEGDDSERPQHSVTIPALEVSNYEVTRGQFAVFAAGRDINNSCNWQNPGFSQTDNHPVVCVSWDDAQAYVEWLSEETEQTYRLLSESEWEYATRAGTTSTYSFGNTITTNDANYRDSSINGTVSVFSSDYSANDFGLYHAHGNVAEWVQDCWHIDYDLNDDGVVDAPTDGSAWEDNCTSDNERVIRGGSWATPSAELRSAFRDSIEMDQNDVGFRIARMPLTIASPQDTSIRLFLDTSPTTQVQVVLGASDAATSVTMTLQLASGGESVVSTATLAPIIFPAVNDDSITRTASFTLLAEGIGETVLTVVVTDELGHEDTVQIRIEVETTYPEMVQVRRGTYTMGSPSTEVGSTADERPQHDVTVPGFEVGRYEVTRGQFAVFADETNFPPSSCTWETPSFTQNNRHPVVRVSLNDAQAYVRWLSTTTGQTYRLLSEAEWEYVARAGTTSTYSVQNDDGTFGRNTITQRDARYGASATVAVGSYRANAFGLYDVHGNAAEWVEDCWHGNYNGAPTDGSVWEAGCQTARLTRGGGYAFGANLLRSADRFQLLSGSECRSDVGFRVARTVPTPEIAAFQNDSFILVRGDDELAMVEVPVTINVTEPNTDPITMRLQIDTGGESVVSTTPSGTITFPPATAGNTSATFMLVAKDGGETMLTIVVTDGLGNTTEKKINVETIPAPQMVRVESGTFMMGSTEADIQADSANDNEGPQRSVDIPGPFEVGRYEVTREEFKYFLDSPTRGPLSTHSTFTNVYNSNWDNSTYYSQANFPASYVRWTMAKRYVAWLSEKTGRTYRLLSEAEWEYAARARTTGAYYGDVSLNAFRNSIRHRGQNQPVASPVAVDDANYLPNGFGLHHVYGNVSEWVEDCWHNSYTGAPTDGSAWTGNCAGTPVRARVHRGGSSRNFIADVRSARRFTATRDSEPGAENPQMGASSEYIGFRIARTLPMQ